MDKQQQDNNDDHGAVDYAAFSIRVIELLLNAVKTYERVRALPQECDEIVQYATALQSILHTHQATLPSQTTNMLLQAISMMVNFAAELQIASGLLKAYELKWREELPMLKEKLMRCLAMFSAETLAKILVSQAQVSQEQEKHTASLNKQDEHLKQQTDQLENIRLSIVQTTRQLDALELNVSFGEGNKNLVISGTATGWLVGGLTLTESTPPRKVNVVCKPTQLEYSNRVRHAEIYRLFSSAMPVERYYGIARHQGSLWAVMEDCRTLDSLAKTIEQRKLPTAVEARITLAIEAAQTVSNFHSVNILVKGALTDANILIKWEEDVPHLVFTELQQARSILTTTDGRAEDVRYEAPEFYNAHSKKPHTLQTDRWALGILIWQIIAGKFPFEISQAITSDDNVTSLRDQLGKGALPWGSSNEKELPAGLKELLVSCWAKNPRSRSSAESITKSLIEILEYYQSGLTPPLLPDPDFLERVRSQLRGKETLDDDDKTHLLQCSVHNPNAAFLLAVAYLNGCVQVDTDELKHLIIAKGDSNHIKRELRLRASIPLLEFAARAGEMSALETLKDCYKQMCDIISVEVTQTPE